MHGASRAVKSKRTIQIFRIQACLTSENKVFSPLPVFWFVYVGNESDQK